MIAAAATQPSQAGKGGGRAAQASGGAGGVQRVLIGSSESATDSEIGTNGATSESPGTSSASSRQIAQSCGW